MKRGENCSKPRPAIIIQSDKFDATLSITICPLTGTFVDAVPARFAIEPSDTNGLRAISHVMVDKIAILPKSKVGRRIGSLNFAEVALLNQTLALFLGLADEQSRS